MKDLLEDYLRGVLMARPRVWDCGRFALGSLMCHAPEVGKFMLDKWPAYANYREGAAEYARRGIDSAWSYCEAVIEFSEGRLVHGCHPFPGDLAYCCNMIVDGKGYPAAGVVVDHEAAFLDMRGGIMRVPADDLMCFARVASCHQS